MDAIKGRERALLEWASSAPALGHETLIAFHPPRHPAESGQRLELDGFEALVEGSSITVTDLQNHVCERDGYLPAHEALRLGLVAGIVH